MKTRHICTALATLLFGIFTAVSAQEIPNTLRLSFPWDLTYLPVSEADAGRITRATASGHTRPVQMETVTVNGRTERRAWFVATLDQREDFQDDRGRNQNGIRNRFPVQFDTHPIEPGIRRTTHQGMHLIHNGLYEVRIRCNQTFDPPVPLTQVPHWFAGGRLAGDSRWDGRAWFDGDSMVRGVSVEVVQEGPVFIDLKVRYDFVAENLGETEALPLEMGKQTHTWEPDTPPRETVPKLSHAYELKLRFVMGDPLIEVNERFHLPRSEGAGDFGVHQYWFNWGDPSQAPAIPGFSNTDQVEIDTVTWVRWFLYDQFGGNSSQNFVPARPRPDQRGRPFALLRPRWNQGGGGAQDFIVTAGGENPPSPGHIFNRVLGGRLRDLNRAAQNDEAASARLADVNALRQRVENEPMPARERHELIMQIGNLMEVDIEALADNYDSENPAFGVIATFASKWVGPFPATIATRADDDSRANARFPLIDGERSGLHYGQRAYALAIGPRSRFNHLNDIVRRHSDWTLVAQTNHYILEWERDPALAGPNMFITRARLEELREAYRRDTGVEAEIFREEMEGFRALQEEIAQLDETVRGHDQRRRDNSLPAEERAAATEAFNQSRRELNEAQGRMNNPDMHILQLITNPEFSRSINPQDASLWLQRRYQDDFLNPTQRATRNVKDYAEADLFAGGRPVGGPMNAALGYIKTDLDAWPGWHQGWSPGNPNFHTDKYMGAIYIAGALRDHPHSADWLQYGLQNFMYDIHRVLIPPDGVGVECPGYSGYSLGLQLQLARILVNLGVGNPVAEDPLFRNTGIWHRSLITPYNHRIARRHAAPLGNTHRWDSGLQHGFGILAPFFRETNPAFASEMQGTWQLLLENGLRIRNPLRLRLIDTDPNIPAMDPLEMDWSSRTFFGFGAIFRNHFGSDRESFLTFKAGIAQGHYHNDELSYHFYSHGQPISLDYNTGYTPWANHAGLHNSMTFGNEGTVLHNQRDERVRAMEEINSVAHVGGFASSPEMDVVVAERRANTVSMTPLFPEDHEFSRNYGSRSVSPIVHRRFLAMVKQPADSPLFDYLVVRDETRTEERQAVNIHLLARELEQVAHNRIHATGQHEMDMVVYVASAENLNVDLRHWWYFDSWMRSPGEQYTIRPGESQAEWAERMAALKREHGVDSLPLPGWQPRWRGREPDEDWHRWDRLLRETDGQAMIPPVGWSQTWLFGEYQKWVRLETAPGTPVLWVLYPHVRGSQLPEFETLANGTGVRVILGDHVDEIFLATSPEEGIPGQAVLRRQGTEQVLLPLSGVPDLGQIPNQPLTTSPQP